MTRTTAYFLWMEGSLPLLASTLTSRACRDSRAHERQAPAQDLRTPSLSVGVRLHRSIKRLYGIKATKSPHIELGGPLSSVISWRVQFQVDRNYSVSKCARRLDHDTARDSTSRRIITSAEKAGLALG